MILPGKNRVDGRARAARVVVDDSDLSLSDDDDEEMEEAGGACSGSNS